MSSPPTRRKRLTGEGQDKNTKNMYWWNNLRENICKNCAMRCTTTDCFHYCQKSIWASLKSAIPRLQLL